MVRLSDLRLRTKLIATFGFVVGAGVLLGGWSITQFRWAAGAFHVVSHEDMPALMALADVDAATQQALDAERKLMFVPQGSEEGKAMRTAHVEGLARARARWDDYRKLPAGAAERGLLPAFETALKEWQKTTQEIVGLLAQDTADARKDAIDVSQNEGAPQLAKAKGILRELSAARVKAVDAFAARARATATRTGGWAIALVTAALAGGGGLAIAIARAIDRPVGNLLQMFEAIRRGDLTARVAVDRHDEVGRLAEAANAMAAQMHRILAEVGAVAGRLGAASQQLAAGVHQLSSGAQEQASSLEETAASLEQMTSTVRQNADNARQANQTAARAREVADQGGTVVKEAVASMEAITASSKQIAAIITTIDEIAFQTNLLALNAAVEAARAGEQGRGFAVVAGEVRALAQRAAAASKEIKTLITDSVGKVEEGEKLVTRSGETLAEIVGGVKKVAELIAEISAASQEQAQGIDQVNRAVTQMDAVTQQNAAQTEELSSTAQGLAAQAQEMSAQVAKFRLAGHGAAAPPAPAAPVAVAAPDGKVVPLVARAKRKAGHPPVAGAATGTGHGQGSFEEFSQGGTP